MVFPVEVLHRVKIGVHTKSSVPTSKFFHFLLSQLINSIYITYLEGILSVFEYHMDGNCWNRRSMGSLYTRDPLLHAASSHVPIHL